MFRYSWRLLPDSLVPLLLARRAIKGRAAVLDDALDRAAATRRPAWLALAIIDAEVMLEHAEVAVGQPVIAQRRTAVLDRRVEHRLDALDQEFCALVRLAFSVGECRRHSLR